MTLTLDPTPTSLLDRVLGKIIRTIRNVRRKRLRRRLLSLSPSPIKTSVQDFSLHMLICHRDLEMAICAAKSFILASRQAYLFTFHDDGSLSDLDKKSLYFHFPKAVIIDYTTSLKKAKDTFGEESEIYKMRLKGVMMLKLIDIRLFSDKKKALLLDSDILFFENPTAIFNGIEATDGVNLFNKDIETCYMADQKELEKICGHALPENVNAGLSVLNTSAIRFDLLENWLVQIRDNDIKIILHRIEQSLISMLCTNPPYSVQHLPKTYDVSFFKEVDSSVCKHYVGKIRHGFEMEGLVYLLEKKAFEKQWHMFVKGNQN